MNLKLEKLFTAGVAAVIGASFAAVSPANANGWIGAGTTSDRDSLDVQRVRRSGSAISVRYRESGSADRFT